LEWTTFHTRTEQEVSLLFIHPLGFLIAEGKTKDIELHGKKHLLKVICCQYLQESSSDFLLSFTEIKL
jgi:hypothetical protein